MKLLLKRLLYPGIDLHSRERYRRVPGCFGDEIGPGCKVLDAGCGNGMLSYQAWKRKAVVLGVSIKQNEVAGCQALFNHALRIPESELQFRKLNLNAMEESESAFDAIICTEALEHIRDDRGVCRRFHKLLKPGGVLHMTTPNAEHPFNAAFPLDTEEKGGHVRPGYTERSFRNLLEPLGFRVERIEGLGGPMRQWFTQKIVDAQDRHNRLVAVLWFLLAVPWLWLDSHPPRLPFCLYVRARKAAPP